MPTKIRAAVQHLAADGHIDRADVGKLIESAKDWGMVTRAEKSTLKDLLRAPIRIK